MSLADTLSQATTNSQNLIREIATIQFGSEDPQARAITRRWQPIDAAKLVGKSKQAIQKAEAENRLPAPDMMESGATERRVGYTIEQIHFQMDYFGTRPGRNPETDAPQVICVCGHKGGSWKTSTAVHMAQWAAMHGYRVLLWDMDPQATASAYHGYVYGLNTTDDDTALPFFLGEESDPSYAIQETSWPGLDIIPSGLGMQDIETKLDQLAKDGALEFEPHMMLRGGIESVYSDYDMVLVDGSPNLGEGTVNMICAADIILCPTPAELNDYMSTGAFFTGVQGLLQDIDLSGFEPDLRVLITKYNPHPDSAAQWMADQIRKQWAGLVLDTAVSITDEVGKGQIRMLTVYQQDKDQRGTAKAWKRAQNIWDQVFEEIIAKCVNPRWPSKQEVTK